MEKVHLAITQAFYQWFSCRFNQFSHSTVLKQIDETYFNDTYVTYTLVPKCASGISLDGWPISAGTL